MDDGSAAQAVRARPERKTLRTVGELPRPSLFEVHVEPKSPSSLPRQRAVDSERPQLLVPPRFDNRDQGAPLDDTANRLVARSTCLRPQPRPAGAGPRQYGACDPSASLHTFRGGPDRSDHGSPGGAAIILLVKSPSGAEGVASRNEQGPVARRGGVGLRMRGADVAYTSAGRLGGAVRDVRRPDSLGMVRGEPRRGQQDHRRATGA